MDCLVREGEVLWLVHTRGSAEKDASRSVYWVGGVDLPELDRRPADRGPSARLQRLLRSLYGPAFLPA